MKPYFEDESIQIYNCDFREGLPSLGWLTVGEPVIITDPPYNIGFGGYDEYDDAMDDEEYIEMIASLQQERVVLMTYPEEMMRLITPALGPAEHFSTWCVNSNTTRRFRLIGYWGVLPEYSRIKQPYKNLGDKRIQMLMQEGNGGANLYEWWDDIQLVKNVSQEKTAHPCPIPERLADRLITLTTNIGETVIDPFMGSGTVIKEAARLGRKAIGFEISERYCEIAVSRLVQRVLV
jgi:DNA modification methylase